MFIKKEMKKEVKTVYGSRKYIINLVVNEYYGYLEIGLKQENIGLKYDWTINMKHYQKEAV